MITEPEDHGGDLAACNREVTNTWAWVAPREPTRCHPRTRRPVGHGCGCGEYRVGERRDALRVRNSGTSDFLGLRLGP